jgi:hypothetical protein
MPRMLMTVADRLMDNGPPANRPTMPARAGTPEPSPESARAPMPTRFRSPILIIQAAIIIGLVWAIALLGRDEFQTDQDEQTLRTPPAKVVGERVLIPADAQRAAGIVIQQPAPAEYRAAQRYFGVVADGRSLVDARQRHLAVISQVAATEAQLAQRRADLARVEGLFNEGRNATAREVEAAHAAVAVEEQRLNALLSERQAIADGLRVGWGDALAERPGDSGSLLARVAAHKIELIQFVLPTGIDPGETKWRVNVATAESKGVSATLVGRSPQTVAGLQGDTWLLAVPPAGLPAGARVRVLADSSKTAHGVRIPPSAVVRFGGKAWVYVRVAPDQFERRALALDRPLTDGVFSDALTPDVELVTSGAQLVLSEEFKFQIKNENTD